MFTKVFASYRTWLTVGMQATSKRLLAGLILTFFPLVFASSVQAGHFTPPGLYNAEHMVLANGLQLVLKERNEAHTASIRLVVNVGSQNFPRGSKAIPHFLEHLMFTGTSKHTETELEKSVNENGGTWNAYTRSHKTVYEIDIYSRNVIFALEILHEIIADSTFPEDKIEITRDVIHRENGGRPSGLRRWLYDRDIAKPVGNLAFEALLPDMALHEGLVVLDSITREDIIDAYDKYYVPGNMTLVLVGEFDKKMALATIKSTFGSLTEKDFTLDKMDMPPYINASVTVDGVLSPLVDTEGYVGTAFRTGARYSEDYYPLKIIEEYLENSLYEVLRIETGLSYSPEAGFVANKSYGIFFATADVGIADMKKSLGLIQAEIKTLLDEKVPPDKIERAKRNLLLSWVQGYESNAGFANYYAGSLDGLEKNGNFIDEEDVLERVTPKEVFAAARKYLMPEKSVIIMSSPTLTYTQLFICIGLMMLGLMAAARKIYFRWHRSTPAEAHNDISGKDTKPGP